MSVNAKLPAQNVARSTLVYVKEKEMLEEVRFVPGVQDWYQSSGA